MLNKMKKIIVVVLILTLAFSANVFAVDTSIILETSEYVAYSNFSTYVENVLKLDNKINSSKSLYNIDDEIIGYCFLLSSQSYAITDLNGTIIEAHFEPNNTYDILNDNFNKKIYYGGPFNYYVKSETDFINIATDTIVDCNQAIHNIESFQSFSISNKLAQSINMASVRSITMRFDLDHSLKTISYNPGGVHCASTAAAIVLHYLDDYKNSNIIPDELDDSTGIKMVDHLIPFIHCTPSVGFVTVNEIRKGVNNYFISRNMGNYMVATDGFYPDTSTSYPISTFFTSLRQIIEMDYPIIIIFSDTSGQGKHFYVIHGLLQDVSGGQYYAYVNNGLGSNNVMLNLNYAVNVAVIYDINSLDS
ncbi:MAG: hypothetical protein IJX55_07455 [Clostridia bacterium]|nr:hypothetical protein [Clostridia bacterium]